MSGTDGSPQDGSVESIAVGESIWIAAFAGVVWLIKWFTFGLQPVWGDGLVYLLMAKGVEGDPPHYCHILGPRIAGLFPDPTLGFFLLGALSFVGTSVTMGILLRHPSFASTFPERLLGVAFFMASYVGVAMFRAFFLNDALAYWLLSIACAGTIYRRDRIVSLATLLGVFQRETALFVIPVWVANQIRTYSPGRLLARFVWVFTPAFAGYILLHKTSLFFGRRPPQFIWWSPDVAYRLWRTNLEWLGTRSILTGLGICVILSYGPAWLVAVRGFTRAILGKEQKLAGVLVDLSGLALPVGLSLLVVDWRRGFQPLFLLIIPSAVIGCRMITSRHQDWHWYIFSLGTSVATGLSAEAWWISPMRVPVALAGIVWLVVLLTAVIGVRDTPMRKHER